MPANRDKKRDPHASLALLWGERDQPRRGPKPKLTVAELTGQGIAIADAEGLDAVSMQRLAEAVGVTTMALYRYIPGKSDLVDLMADAVFVDPPTVTGIPGGWRPQLAAWSRACWDRYREHPWLLAAIGMRRQAMGPHQVAWLDAALAALAPTGLSAKQQHDAVILILGHIRSVTQQLLDHDEAGSQEWDRLTADLLDRNSERFPALTRAVAAGAFAPTDDDPLDFGLTCILDGVAALM
ncbi:TetR/AcrR family transcriptional regulator [Streptomyces olivoreticuli]|uniref:TetR/AcrR family transcriptional regulator n=1 Tax=Streptomyces olivoreticuli TaxID=68246 RepID=UPI000E23E73B